MIFKPKKNPQITRQKWLNKTTKPNLSEISGTHTEQYSSIITGNSRFISKPNVHHHHLPRERERVVVVLVFACE